MGLWVFTDAVDCDDGDAEMDLEKSCGSIGVLFHVAVVRIVDGPACVDIHSETCESGTTTASVSTRSLILRMPTTAAFSNFLLARLVVA